MTNAFEKKRKIEEGEHLYRQIFNFAPVAMWEKDDEALYREIELLKKNGITNFRKYLEENTSEIMRLVSHVKLKNVNDESLHLLEAESKEEILSGFQRLFTEESIPVLKEGIIGVAEGKKRLNIHSVLKSFKGTRLEILFGFDFRVGNSINESLVTLTDVTATKNAERALKESDERLRLATQTSSVGIWEWNVITNKIRWDAQMFSIYGVTPTVDGFIEYQSWSNAVVPEDLAEQEKTLQDTVKNFSTSNRSFKIYRPNDHQLRYIEATEAVRTNANGQAEWVVGTNIDVTERKIAEEQLIKLATHLDLSTTSAGVGVWLLDINSGKLEWSVLHKRLWGYKENRTDLGYEDWHQVIHPEDKEKCFAEVEAAKQEKRKYEVDYRIHRANDGVLRWVKSVGQYQYNDNGQAETLTGISIDITDAKIAEEKIKESEENFRHLAESMPQKVWTADAEGNRNYFNKDMLDFTGLSFEELKDWGWKKAIHPDDLEETIERWQHSIVTGNDFEHEHRLINKSGEYKWHLSRAGVIKDKNGKLKMWIGTKTLIQEQKEQKDELEKAKSNAEREKRIAEDALKFKQQFLSNMSHEIRTPLNSILGFTNVLLKTELGIEQKEFIQAIKTSGKSLNQLINDILDLAKVDAGKMTFEKQPFELHESIRSILYSFDLKIKENNLELVKIYDNEIPSMLVGDSLRLNQVILNLISNAVKFTHKGKIIISVKLLSETEENVTIEFTVTDSGIGIAANKIKSIFNVFEQAEVSTANSYGGTGLGLAIVKQLIEAQGGSISLSSKLGEGSTFRFILPFGKTKMKSEGEIEILKPYSEIKNLRVLVAEDVSLNQLLIKILLSDIGFEYEIVSNGKIAIEKLQTNTYDIILMDLHMPEMNGFAATEYIRKTMKSQIPIIALTADVTTADVFKCKEFGMDDYISKPINENLLYSKIVALVKGKK